MCFRQPLKVLLALLIISVVIGLGAAILSGLGSVVGSPPASTDKETDIYETEADTLRTMMPKSAWDEGIARAVKKHCFTHGMNKEEVVRALGEPTKKEDHSYNGESTWTWKLPPGKCLKYDGDKCVEQEERDQTIYFTANGNVRLAVDGCQTVNDDYVYFDSRELFVTTEKQGRVPPPLPAPKASPVESEN